jgi:hypothetical protein
MMTGAVGAGADVRGRTMTTRAEKRAAARAGRGCPVCGEPVHARRSTARYCSTRCRMQAHRDSGKPRRKGGLVAGQVRILKALSETKGVLSRTRIAEEAGVSQGQLPVYLGHVDPERRKAAAARWGIISLLERGYVDEVVVDIEGKKERDYEITPAGREALKDEG